MYFDLEDYHPDITPIGRAISWREGVLLSIIAHLCLVILILLFPKFFHDDSAARARLLQAQAEQPEHSQFVFVAPRRDIEALKAPPRAEPSDKDRIAQAPEKAPKPTNPLPFSRGNTPERVDAPPAAPPERAKGQGPTPDPAQSQQAQAQNDVKAPESPSNMQFQTAPNQVARNNSNANGKSPLGGGSLGDALRNLQRYVPREQFDNPGGNGGQFGPEIQFDTKGVEFGPWIRRFIAQVKRNWFIPYAAMSNKGHVVVTFNVHKDGSITDLAVIGPCPIEPFNNAAFGALSASNPTVPLPPEYPSEKAFFTVTFFYNESPP